MIWMMVLSAHAQQAAALRHTAHTLASGDVVVRLPTGRSGLGLGQGFEAQVTPFDWGIGGTRVGVEKALVAGERVTLSLSPSVAERWTLRRTSLRVMTNVSLDLEQVSLHVGLGPDLRVQRRVELANEAESDWSVSELRLPVHLAVDWRVGASLFRGTLFLPLLQEREPLRYVAAAACWYASVGPLGFGLGAGLLAGRPVERQFLGRYERMLWAPYPQLDLMLAL